MFSFLKKKKNLLPNFYGLSYALSIYFTLNYIEKNKHQNTFKNIHPHIESIGNIMLLSGIFFARIGWVLTNSHGNWRNWYKIWHGGQAFFGSVIGILLGSWFCSLQYNIPFLELTDCIAFLTPFITGSVRLGNHLVNDFQGRFGLPVSLIEAFCHGPLVFYLINKNKGTYKLGKCTQLFIKFYGYSRFFTEFFRKPEGQYFINNISLEQYFSLLFIFPKFIFLFIDQVFKHKIPKTKNYGFNLGLFSKLPRSFKVFVQILASISILYNLRKQMNIFILSGCFSNLYDRIKYGYVIDYIPTPLGVCNLADIYLWLGLILVTIPQHKLEKIQPLLFYKIKKK